MLLIERDIDFVREIESAYRSRRGRLVVHGSAADLVEFRLVRDDLCRWLRRVAAA